MYIKYIFNKFYYTYWANLIIYPIIIYIIILNHKHTKIKTNIETKMNVTFLFLFSVWLLGAIGEGQSTSAPSPIGVLEAETLGQMLVLGHSFILMVNLYIYIYIYLFR